LGSEEIVATTPQDVSVIGMQLRESANGCGFADARFASD
jgi:hypothetical protein